MTNRTDNFNRADTTNGIGTPSDAGSAWSQLSGTWGISSNRAYESANTGQAVCVLEASASNVEVQVTLVTLNVDPGLIARAADDSNYILLAVGTNGFLLYKKVSGSFTQLDSYVGTISAGAVIKLRVDS